MDRFSKIHPMMQFVFFLCVLTLSISVFNPVFSAVSLVCALLYEFKIRGARVLSRLKSVPAIVFFVGIFNMIFSHYGEDVLFRIGDTEFTLEALLYGMNQGVLLAAMMIWFSLFSLIMDSERIIWLFRFAPKTAMVFSMVLGFIPRFRRKLRRINEARLGMNAGQSDPSLRGRLKQSLDSFSALISYTLESSIITADSMSAREYNPRAVMPSRYRLGVLDFLLTAFAVICFLIVLTYKLKGLMVFVFEPVIYFESFSIVPVIAFLLLALLPLLVDLTEDILWKLSTVKV